MKLINLKIITPEGLVLEELVEQVSLPTTRGEITILPDHIPMIVDLASGDIVALVKGEHLPIAVVGGFVEIKKALALETEVTVLADFAEAVSGLSESVIEEAKLRAAELKKKMENKELVDFEHFATELERSLTRVKIADKWRNKKYRK
jgi:F-type H+-transporting ATPase subunit epsilon